MKKQLNIKTVNTSQIIIIISIISMFYFGYEIIYPIFNSININIEPKDYTTEINTFFK